MDLINNFSSLLLDWHSTVERDLPWKDNKNVFHIWLSEIILQQTRVEQGKPYFLKFKARFKNVQELAEATDEELMKLWQGLGYYSRARNLHFAAKQIIENGGEFPTTYEGLLSLKGVGPYTAAAIASFAYDLPTPVIDGNVNRVISRIVGIVDPVDTNIGKKEISTFLHSVFDEKRSSDFNQAIMDFGAIICKPKSPLCGECPFQNDCFAHINHMEKALPFKSKKILKKDRTFHYIIIEHNHSIFIRKRKEKDIWKHLHEFPVIEKEEIEATDLAKLTNLLQLKTKLKIKTSKGPYKHILTHQNLKVYFHHTTIKEMNNEKPFDYFLVSRENLVKFAFPKIIDWYLNEKSIYLKKNYIKPV
jgi:A/G-specific adenine glycosylase